MASRIAGSLMSSRIAFTMTRTGGNMFTVIFRGALRFAVAGLAIMTWPIAAQVTGRISGFVKDPAGAAIPSVNVTARMTEQQSTSTARTNADGSYDLLALPPGNYQHLLDAS